MRYNIVIMKMKKVTRLHLTKDDKEFDKDLQVERLLAQLKYLGCKSVEEYQEWCSNNGFSSNPVKSVGEYQKEIKHYKDLQLKLKLSLANKKKKVKIEKKEDLFLFVLDPSIKKAINDLSEIKLTKFIKLAALFKEHLSKNSNILFFYEKTDNTIINSILNMVELSVEWNYVNLEKIRLKNKNLYSRQNELIDILFGKFKVNTPLYSLWNKKRIEDRLCLIKVLKGESLHRSWNFSPERIKLGLTNKEIHNLNTVKSGYSYIEQAVFEQILNRNKMSHNFKREIMNNFDFILTAFNDSEKMELFVNFVAYLSKQVLFDSNQIFPLWDYIDYKKRIFRNRGINFVLKDQNISNLYNEMLQWHEITTKGLLGKAEWSKSSKISPYLEEFELLGEEGVYKIVELVNTIQLNEEGAKMKHCVATYANKCFQGQTSIWSLRKESKGGKNMKRLLTVQVTEMRIVQVRGICNRMATESEKSFLREWARQNSLFML